MKRNIFTLALVLLVLGLLVTLNLVFMSDQREREDEWNGDRSTYKGTPYGTLAYYTMLSEQKKNVQRFEKPWTELADSDVHTLFVIVPANEHNPTKEEIDALSDWVSAGGNLIVVDRVINVEFGPTEFSTSSMLGDEGTAKPVIPSDLTHGAKELRLTRFSTSVTDSSGESVVHFESDVGAVVIDRNYGDGRIALITEPYLLQNNGIVEGDNLALALNLVDSVPATETIAFDEYHHGRGATTAVAVGLREYIAGTPIPWIVGQLGLVALVVAISYGRRFGRPVPLARERRTSALEFVSSMATIHRLAKASDLAVENIYGQFRIRLCQYAGLPTDAKTADVATLAARRGQIDREQLLKVMTRAELALNGVELKPSELVDLTKEIRRIGLTLKV